MFPSTTTTTTTTATAAAAVATTTTTTTTAATATGTRRRGKVGSVYVRLRTESSWSFFAQNCFIGRKPAIASEFHAVTFLQQQVRRPEALFGVDVTAASPFAVACASDTVSRSCTEQRLFVAGGPEKTDMESERNLGQMRVGR